MGSGFEGLMYGGLFFLGSGAGGLYGTIRRAKSCWADAKIDISIFESFLGEFPKGPYLLEAPYSLCSRLPMYEPSMSLDAPSRWT